MLFKSFKVSNEMRFEFSIVQCTQHKAFVPFDLPLSLKNLEICNKNET